MAKMKWYDWLAYIILVIGAINWGIFGISRFLNKSFDLIAWTFGNGSANGLINVPWIGYVIYVLVGIAGLYAIVTGVKLALK
jgi:hypothetical protein